MVFLLLILLWRTLVLGRLKRPKVTGKRLTVPKKFELNEHLRKRFALYRGKDGDEQEVVVDLDPWAADEVRGRRWHESQELKERPKGWLRISMRLSSLEEIEKWVMGVGTHAMVVRSEELREWLPKTALELRPRYAQDG